MVYKHVVHDNLWCINMWCMINMEYITNKDMTKKMNIILHPWV